MKAAIYQGKLHLARALARVRINKLHLEDHQGRKNIRKVRSRYASVLVSVGNVLMRCSGESVRVLKTADWQLREAMYSQSESCPFGVVSDWCAGVSLANVLRSAQTEGDFREAFQLAAQALLELQRVVSHEFHGKRSSHGDATCENVVVSLTHKSARWIDYDTRHLTDLDEKERHLDDFRALVCSSCRYVDVSKWKAIVALTQSVLGPERSQAFHANFQRTWRHPTLFQLAQMQLNYRQFQRLLALVT